LDSVTQDANPSPQPGTKKVFATFRNWWKGAFGKKPVEQRESEPAITEQVPIETEATASSG